MRAFPGMLQVGEDTVPATVLFADGSVTLIVAEDQIGSWPASEVDFVTVESGYDIRAEGDSIRFLPDRGTEFSTFVDSGGEPTEPATDTPVETEPVHTETPTGPFPGREGDAEEEENGGGLLGPETALPGLLDGPGEDEPDDTPEPGITVEEPDEYYAAGLSGPGEDTPAPPFRFPSAPTEPPEPSPSAGETPAASPRPASPPGEERTEQDPASVPASRPDPDQEAPAEVEEELPANVAPIRESPPQHDPGSNHSGRAEPEPEDNTVENPLPSPLPPAQEPPSPPEREDPAGEPDVPGSPPGEGTSLASEESEGGYLSRLLRRAGRNPEPEPDPDPHPDQTEEDPGGDLPTPISDSDNLRQWALVGAGGLVLLAIIGMVVWGLASLMGGEEPAAAVIDPEPVATTAPVATVPATTPLTAPPPTTVPAENREAAEEFVTQWNDIARDYAYHLTISADRLPVSTAPTSTVHLRYGEDGILELTMAPRGTGSDRNILVAMGLAVAWADPSVSPEGRKELLGAMGIDVDDPQVSEMGGEVTRNGVGYSTAVTDDVIRFRVDPGS